MIQTNLCQFEYCKKELELDEIDIGYCAMHKSQLMSKYYLTLSCWSCDRLLLTVHKHILVRGVKIRDDYLFTRVCPFCDNTVDVQSLPFMTFTNDYSDPKTDINPEGKLVNHINKVLVE